MWTVGAVIIGIFVGLEINQHEYVHDRGGTCAELAANRALGGTTGAEMRGEAGVPATRAELAPNRASRGQHGQGCRGRCIS